MGGQCKKHAWKDDGYRQGFLVCDYCGRRVHQDELPTRELLEFTLMLVRRLRDETPHRD